VVAGRDECGGREIWEAIGVGRRKSEVRNPRSEGRGQRSEVRVGIRKPEVERQIGEGSMRQDVRKCKAISV